MRINDGKIPFYCNSCECYFYNDADESSKCPQCNKIIIPYRNTLDRHRETCNSCKMNFEVIKKSPYDNSHYLNCDSCMSVLKISYSDSILQKHINKISINSKLGDTQIRNYWEEVESNLNPCLCGGEFKHSNPKRCPFCLESLKEIEEEYLILSNYRDRIAIPLITNHIWKNQNDLSRKNILSEDTDNPILKTLNSYMKTIKYFQENYYSKNQAWADSYYDLKMYAKVENLINHYSFIEKDNLLNRYFMFSVKVLPDTYHFIALPKTKEIINSYLLQGKTGEIEIHPTR